MSNSRTIANSVSSSTLADVLERVLDKGLVIAGDIKIKLVDIELLTIQIRLVVCSVEKAREMGIDWWMADPAFSPDPALANDPTPDVSALQERIAQLEARLAQMA